MTKFFSSKLYKVLLIAGIIYFLYIFSVQQTKLDSYGKDKQYYEAQIASLKDQKEELLKIKENVNSPEYIEEMAREKLDMYLPNERVYIDMGK